MHRTDSSSCQFPHLFRESAFTFPMSQVISIPRLRCHASFRVLLTRKSSSVLDWTRGVPIIVVADCNILFNQSWRVPIRCGETRFHPLVHSRSTSCQQEHFEGESSFTPDARLSSCASGAT